MYVDGPVLDMKDSTFEFTPHCVPGAKNPPLQDQLCYGVDLRGLSEEDDIAQGINSMPTVTLAWERDSLQVSLNCSWAGDIRKMIEDGCSIAETAV